MRFLFFIFAVVLMLSCGPVSAQEESVIDDEAPVDLTADSLENDEQSQTVTAIGNVELVQSGRILRADRVSYNLGTDTVRAQGNVVLTQPTGEVYFADDFELTEGMKDGFATGIRGLIADGGRFSAEQGQRENGTRLTMKDATYTACEPCEEDPDAPLVWQLLASEVVHDQEEQRIIYRDARLEMLGVPILYTPYFSHPDGSVDQKSGFLTPSFGFDSELGANITQSYYWAIDQDKDATVGTMVATDVNPLLLGEYRQRFENASIEVSGGITYSDREDEVGGVGRRIDDEVRGHIQAEALWDINEKWRAGIDSEWTTDDQYMRQYNISAEDVLENRIYAERFSGRNYATVRTVAFQDIRTSERQVDQPNLLPEVKASFIGEPNEALGGRWHANLSGLSLFREGSDQDMVRGSAELGWQRRFISDSGLVMKVSGSGRGDVYYVSDRDIANFQNDRSEDSQQVRGFVHGNVEASYPLVNNFDNGQMVIEPIGSFTAGNQIDVDNDIPNEDSQDTVVDAMNLFEPNRFTGLDRIEDRVKATYGLRAGLHGNNGYRAEVFAGQSYRFDDEDIPFGVGSGLDEDASDYVGMADVQLGSHLNANYRLQLDNADLSSQRHEVDVVSTLGPVSMGGRYFYGIGLDGTEVEETREQFTGSMRYNLNDEWSVFGSARYDFGEDEGLRQAGYGFLYDGQCFNFQARAVRNLTRDFSGDSSTEIFFRIGLKTLGEFETSGLSVSDTEE